MYQFLNVSFTIYFKKKKKGIQKTIVFHDMNSSRNKVTELYRMERAASTVIWSPNGKHCILTNIFTSEVKIEFFNAEENETLCTVESFGCKDIQWDPSGRYVAVINNESMSSERSRNLDSGYKIYTFQGNLLYTMNREKFYQFLWRPRPPSILSDEEIQDIQTNIRQYSRKYEEKDRQVEDQKRKEIAYRTDRERQEFLALIRFRKMQVEQERSTLIDLRHGLDSEDDSQYDIEIFEEENVIYTHSEVIST